MSLGKRRTKPNRAHLRPANPIDIRQARQAQKRARIARFLIVAAAALVTAAIVHGGGPPLTYRLGQRPDREIRVNVSEFQRHDPVKTNAERQAMADKIDPIMTNDPALIRDLAAQLEDLVESIARAPAREAIPEGIATSWELDPATFLDIKAASDTPERLDDLRRQIRTAFEPLILHGILGPDTLPADEDSHLALTIRQKGDPAAVPPHSVPRDQVLPERISKLDGPVAARFAAEFKGSKLGQRIFALVADKLKSTPTLKFEEAETIRAREAARAHVQAAYKLHRKGDVLVAQGEPITEDHLALLRLEHERSRLELPVSERVRRALAVVVLVATLFGLIGYFVSRLEPRVVASPRRLAVLCGLVVVAMGLVRLLAWQPWDAELIPVALAAMILAIAYNPHFALTVSFGLGLLTSLALGYGLGDFLVLVGGTAAAVLPLGEVRTRTKPIQVGFVAAASYFLLTWAAGLFQGEPIALVATDSAWRAGWGLMTGFVLGGSLPFIESAFGIVTGISLLELGDITHPLLQELVRRAPGTHNHSVTVGTIAEAAAERIGANALLVRIGAYFHDIGKMLKPHYFIENQAGATNRHANLAPAMSTLIIVGHVKDGVDLGRQHHLPTPIIDLIEQHHGTTLVEYFYREATRRAGSDPDCSGVQESAFRYPGPKPQTREAGILMISDAVESASRTLSEPTPGRIEGLVGELIEKRLDDNQFDECGLTLREIAEIRESLIKSLIGIYHGRVKYPEQRTA
jgi:putative nucleotidyltransferase with HDIG domain